MGFELTSVSVTIVNDKDFISVTLLMQFKKLLTSFYDSKMSNVHKMTFKYFCIHVMIWSTMLCKKSKHVKLLSYEFPWVGQAGYVDRMSRSRGWDKFNFWHHLLEGVAPKCIDDFKKNKKKKKAVRTMYVSDRLSEPALTC